MELGFAVPQSGSWATPERQVRLARLAESLGYATAWTFQRLLFPVDPQATEHAARWSPVYRSVLDPIVTLSYLAGQTERIRLGVAVVDLPFVNPALLAKQASSLDIVSGGRLTLGLGLGWAPQEYAATGASRSGLGRRADEYLRVLDSLWTDETIDFHGRYYEVPSARMEPKPVQRPRPPVLIGGFSAPALRRAGRLADGWVAGSGADLRALGGQVSAVRQAAVEAGRDPDTLSYVCRGVVRLRAAGAADRAALSGSVEEIRGDLDVARAQGLTELFLDLNFDTEVGVPEADPDESEARAVEVLHAFAPASR
jgi:probable F420-dependent oxidoreductase